MSRKGPRVVRKVLRFVFMMSAYIWLSGCAAIPPAFDYASMALTGATYISTGKGPSDHAISYVAEKDCSLLRLLVFKPMCIPVNVNTNKSLLAQFFRKKKNEVNDEVHTPPTLLNTSEFRLALNQN